MTEDETAVAESAQENDDFAAGFSDEKPAPKPDKPEPAAPSKATEKAEDKPEYVQVTAKELADIRAAAAKTASYDSQLSRVFGTLGNLQKLLNDQKTAQPASSPPAAARKIEISKEAFAEMAKDFPELANLTHAAMERAVAGLPSGGAEIDPAKLEGMIASLTNKREVEILEDRYPDWRDIVGAVDVTKEQPNPDNAFRKWLGTKDAAYQARINGTESAAVITRAIRLFQTETKPAVKPPRDTARADRIREAVQPRGDKAGAAASRTDQDEFEAGFASR